MKTRTIILSGMHNNKCLTGVLTLTGDMSLFCSLHTYTDVKELCELHMFVGKVEYYAQDLMLNIDYNFMVENANVDDELKIAVFNKDDECILCNNLSQKEIAKLSTQKAETQTVMQEPKPLEEETNVNSEPKSFFEAISPQFEQMFLENEHCTDVEGLIQNSLWVKVFDEEENTSKYILGKIFDESGNLKYICYGEPAQNANEIPNTVDLDYAQWLPLTPENENSNGYYLMFQDAKTGQTLKVL